MAKKMIKTACHGCGLEMIFEAVPVKLTELEGTTKTYYGHSGAAWICSTCRQDPSKLKAARLAAGMPAVPSLPEEFDEREVA